jgi:hypothetical protein
MVVTRMFSDRRTDERTDDQTMAAGASVTWTHCSVLFEVTKGKTRCDRADATIRPRGRWGASVRTSMSARTQPSVRADMGIHADASPSPPLSLPPLPSPLSLPPQRPHGREKNKINKIKFILVVVAGLERKKKISIFNFRFSIPKIPKIPKLPELHGLRGRSRKKKKVFSA